MPAVTDCRADRHTCRDLWKHIAPQFSAEHGFALYVREARKNYYFARIPDTAVSAD